MKFDAKIPKRRKKMFRKRSKKYKLLKTFVIFKSKAFKYTGKVSFLARDRDFSYRTVHIRYANNNMTMTLLLSHGQGTVTLFTKCYGTVRKIHVHAPRKKLSL